MQQYYQNIIARVLVVTLFFSSIAIQPLAITPKAQAATASSPTGRDPKFYWSPERQALWNQMRTDNNKWWQLVKYYADRSSTCERRVGDIGQWATIAYQMTGDKKYADAAWTLITTRALQPSYQCTSSGPVVSFLDPNFSPADGRNFTREAFIDFAWMYDWLYPALDTTQRQQFIDTLNRWSDWVLAKQTVNGIPWGTRLNDSDEATGHYFGLAMTALGTTADNTRAQGLLNEQFPDSSQNKTVPVGGLDATAADRSSMRNSIKWFSELAAGGEWIESTEYNLNTLRLLYTGAEATRTATGQDHFPEITALAKQSVLDIIHHSTPDLKDSYQWGDVQEARVFKAEARLDTLGVLSYLTKDDPNVGPYAQGMINDIVNQYGLGFKNNRPATFEPSPSFFVFYNPYAPTADWRTLQKDHFNSGQGLLLYNDLSPTGTLFGAHMPSGPKVDHSVFYQGNFQLYRNGEWIITHPIGYQTSLAQYVNAMLIGGVSGAYESKGVVAEESKSGEFAYIAGSNGGQYYGQPYFNPPPTFLHEWTRSIFYLPGNGNDDAIVVYDRTNAEDPTTLASFDRYREPEKTQLATTTERKQWILHTPKVPTRSGSTTSWQTDKGQYAAVNTLLPTTINEKVIDETTIMTSYTPVAAEKKYQIRISPQTNNQWDTFLNVISASSDVAQPTSALVKSQDGETEGTLVQRTNTDDALILFSAKQGPKLPSQPYGDKLDQLKKNRFRTNNFTVSTTTNSANTRVYMADLDPTKSWTLADNGTTVPLSVSDQGLGKAILQGTGIHNLSVSMNGAVITSPSPNGPSKANIQVNLTVDKSAAKAGDTLTYTITYKNIGNTDANNVTVVQTVPNNTSLISESLARPACYISATNSIQWPINTLGINQEGIQTFKVIVGQDNKPTDSCAQ